MKKKGIAFIFVISLLFGTIAVNSASTAKLPNQPYVKGRNNEVHAVWISSSDFSTLRDRSLASFTKNVKTMFANLKEKGINTVYMQVRSNGGVIYPSNYFPWANWINSSMSNPGYDPLKIMVDTAHSMNLKIEAWISPYRLSDSTAYSNKLRTLTQKNTITDWLNNNNHKNLILSQNVRGQKRLSLNPARSATISLITREVTWLVKKYNINGIHFDEDLYPNTTGTTANQRQRYVNKMLQTVYREIKKIKRNVSVSVNAHGNIQENLKNGANVKTWLQKTGYVDYICPKIFYSDQYSLNGRSKMYSNLLMQWRTLKKNQAVNLYIGLALFKAHSKPIDDIGWRRNTNNLYNQVMLGRKQTITGFSIMGYSYFSSPLTKEEINKLSASFRNTMSTSIKLSRTTATLVFGNTLTLSSTVLPAYSSDKKVAWYSSNENIAVVSSNGVVHPVGVGTAVITSRTTLFGKTAKCTVKVQPKPIRLNASRKVLHVGDTFQLIPSVFGAKGDAPQIKYHSSSPTIATITYSGAIYAKKAGTTTITATIQNESHKKASISVTVLPKESAIQIACVGDSNTYLGGRLHSYPVVLGNLLGSGYKTTNYGISGASLLSSSYSPYFEKALGQQSLSSKANIVIVMLGTNDSRPVNWNAKRFKKEYIKTIQKYKKMNSKPEVIIMIPPYIRNHILPESDRNARLVANNGAMGSYIRKMIPEIALASNVRYIDLYSLTKSHPEWYADYLHLNAVGYESIAKYIYKKISIAKTP